MGSEVARAPLACLWSGGHRRCERCEIKRKTEPVGPVSSQNLSFWRFEALLNQNACFWGLTQITDFLIPLNFYFPFSVFIDPVRCSYLGVSDVYTSPTSDLAHQLTSKYLGLYPSLLIHPQFSTQLFCFSQQHSKVKYEAFCGALPH